MRLQAPCRGRLQPATDTFEVHGPRVPELFGSIVYDESRAMVDYQRSNAESRLRNIYRIVVLGTTGAGKTTLARQIAEALDMPHVELDYYRFRPNWVEVPNDEFRERVRKALRGDRWVADGNYGLARDVIWPRATMLVWLDYPIYVVMWRLFWRTISPWSPSQGAVARQQGKALVALLQSSVAVSLGAEDSLAAAATDAVTDGAA